MTELVHIGLAVRDLAAAMEVLGASAGLDWARPQVRRVEGIASGRPLTTEVTVTWSLQGPPHLELIQGGPSTPWETARETELHHVARWTGDLPGEVARLVALGWQLELTGAAGAGEPSAFAYLKRPDGMRVELMDQTAMQAGFEQWLSGGHLPGTVR